MATECVVHHRKYLSKFHANVNELRRSNEFNVSILGKSPKRCCSCNNQTGETSFTVDHLRALSRQIESAMRDASLAAGQSPLAAPTPVKTMQYVFVRLPPTAYTRQRTYKIGRFVGKGGKNIQTLERRLRITIHLLNHKTGRQLRSLLQEKQRMLKTKQLDDLPVYFTVNDEKANIANIKQSIEATWDAIAMTLKSRKRPAISAASEPEVYASAPVEGDSRWKPKKRIPKSKLKAKERQSSQQATVPAQPWVKPISMPTEISKFSKRR